MIGRRINMNGNYRSDILKRFLMDFFMNPEKSYENRNPDDWVREASTKCWEEIINKSMHPVFGLLPCDDIGWNKIK